MSKQMEREEQQLEDDLAAGLISQAEFNRDVRELHRDYYNDMHDAAQCAYDRELHNW